MLLTRCHGFEALRDSTVVCVRLPLRAAAVGCNMDQLGAFLPFSAAFLCSCAVNDILPPGMIFWLQSYTGTSWPPGPTRGFAPACEASSESATCKQSHMHAYTQAEALGVDDRHVTSYVTHARAHITCASHGHRSPCTDVTRDRAIAPTRHRMTLGICFAPFGVAPCLHTSPATSQDHLTAARA